jgi:hypothetical protein
MVLFFMNAHQVNISTPVSIQSCGGSTLIAPPLCLYEDRSCERHGIVGMLMMLHVYIVYL